ncbi:phosphoribosylamine--glycine ligase [Bacillota bacterium Meth-B3]
MNVMIVGGGGREHALAVKIAENKRVRALYALPGNAGIAQVAKCVPIAATDIEGLVRFAKEHRIDFAVVAPDDPLALGAVDRLHEAGIRCFGPTKAAAMIESSKIYAKDLMRRYAVPTAAYRTFDGEAEAIAYLADVSFPRVVKADGLALGKGVVIARDFGEAREAVHAMMAEGAFGEGGRRVVIEECLEGPEVTVLAFTDGHTLRPMISSMDHKRAFDGDRGPNTGGMGVIAPSPFYTPEVAQRAMREIFLPTVEAMRKEGRPFKGCLYFGLMLTADGPKVIEYNARFGDPEAQAVLSLLESDLLDILISVEDERLAEADVRFRDGASCVVVVASGGYPGPYEKGLPVCLNGADGLARAFHSGTALKGGALVTNGGRVLGMTAAADDLATAVERATEAAARVRFEGAFFRRDIGRRALERRE